ncbi:sensor histidine kinase [Amycolatopsis sp. NPDC021455]|uniref:sensor histidine kinase n=1 Tax=Amycolatopsis sp. NPDC021455 TaxID=3154901 RepID=UPI0033EE09FD
MWAAKTRARRYGTAHPLLVDAVVSWLLVVGIVLAARYNYAIHGREFDLPGMLLTAAATPPITLRRRAPVTVLLVCLAGSLASVIAGYWDALNNFGPLLAVYTVAVFRSRLVSVSGAVLATAVLAGEGIAAELGPPWLLVLLAAVFCAVVWAVGDVRRILTERNAQLAALTRRLERDREAQARRAVTEERMRIARELHDVLAHHMSVIAVQAGLARYVLESDPPTAIGALRAIGDTSSQVLDEMRRLLALLRPDPDPADDSAPAFSLDRIDALVDRVRALGVPVELTVSGVVRALPDSVALCVYRIVQESLTNVVKHAGKARASVSLDYGDAGSESFTARIVDDGRDGRVPEETGGHGLIGMRERAKLYGGTLTAGPRAHGGFEVVLELPVTSTGGSGSGGRG